MNAENILSWHEANQAYLVRALYSVRVALEQQSGVSVHPEADAAANSFAKIEPMPALERLCAAFGLSRFEREILLLCAGMELDAAFAQVVAAAQPESRLTFPTFGLALAAFAEPHWSALAPTAPLRRWRLIEIDNRDSLTTGKIRIDERVLHYLAGVTHLDERLSGLLQAIPQPDDLPRSQVVQAERIARYWSQSGGVIPPVIQLCGGEARSKRAVAAAACAALGLELYAIRADAVPHNPA